MLVLVWPLTVSNILLEMLIMDGYSVISMLMVLVSSLFGFIFIWEEAYIIKVMVNLVPFYG